MARAALPPHISALLSPAAYPHPANDIQLVQTHISYVFLVDDVVYKIKKPFDFGFLDYSSLAKRKHFSEEEVRLNRRLCEATYIGVVPIASGPDGMKLDAAGEVLDYAVMMRRLPQDRMMSHLLERDAIVSPMLNALARCIAAFHLSSERGSEIDRYAGLETVSGNWRENF